jgi:DNA-binding LacI/PurR family transcriptional regulator
MCLNIRMRRPIGVFRRKAHTDVQRAIMSVTAKDIARELGLSQPTVSRILSGARGYRVSTSTRARVLEAAQRLEYQPNAVARSLRHGRTHSIGLYTVHDYDARNDFLSALIAGLQRACNTNHLDLLMFAAFRDRSKEEIFNRLRDRRIDGLFLHATPDDPLVERLASSSLHVMALVDALPGIPSVTFDNADGIRQLIEYSMARGYRRFAFLAPHQRLSSVEHRCRAFQNLLCERGVPESQLHIHRIHFEDVDAILPTLLESGKENPEQPLAVFCWNDRAAYNLLRRCQECGVRVPEELAVMGFDGFIDTKLPSRQLVTIICPWEQLAATAMEILLRHMGGEEAATETCLPVTLWPGDTA